MLSNFWIRVKDLRHDFGALAVFLFLAMPSYNCAIAAAGGPEGTIWAIGKPDGSSIEFAPGWRDKVTFTVGQSVLEKDFPTFQGGSISLDPGMPAGERPYTIVFDLDEAPKGGYELAIDFIYQAGAPGDLKVDVNGRKGIFPLLPEAKEEIDSNEANSMLLAKQRIVVPIDGSWLKLKGNQITLTPLGAGGVEYDAVSFKKSASRGVAGLRLEPTVFYRTSGGKLVEICRLHIPFRGKFRKGTATIQLGGQKVTTTFANADYDFGVLAQMVEVPVPDQPAKVSLSVRLDGRSQRATQDFTPAKKWNVYICPKVHNDVGYTDIQPQVNELDTRNTDTVLDILAKYPFYKFNFEASWLVDNFLNSRPVEHRKRFLDQAARGRVALNAFYLNLLTGLSSGEELHRAMYFTYRLHKEHGGNFDFACLTDAPSHTWFLPTLLTDVGIKAFSNGSNQTRAPILQFSDLNEDSPFYWEGMNGERVMMWYARSYLQLKRLVSTNILSPASSYDYMKMAVPQFLLRYQRADYVPDAVMIYGAYVDNAAVPETGEGDLIERWNQEYAYPKLVVSTDAGYFAYVEKNFADRLKVYRGDAGAYWEDGAGSTARATQVNRHTQQVLPAAETVSSFATLFDSRNRYPAEEFRDAWKNVMFYDEHTWGAHNSIRQPDREFVTRQWEIKKSYATRANLDARNLLTRSLFRLFQEMTVEGDTVFTMNLQNWARSAPVEVELDEGRYLVDLTTNKPVEMDVVFEKDGWRKVRFLAETVPALGYKGYALRSLDPPEIATAKNQKVAGASAENQYYRLEVDLLTGGLKSLFDKAAGKELLDPRAPYKLNQYLYVSGGDNTLIIDNVVGRPLPELTLDSPRSAKIVENVKTPLGQRIVVEMSAKNTPGIRSEYLLYDHLKRVDIRNEFSKEETRDKEAVYFAYPFATAVPALEYQIQNGWVRPNQDQLPGACREWFTTQNLVHVKDGGFSIAWATPDAPLITLTDINRGKWPRHLEIKNGHVFSYALNNYWFTNYKAAQGGKFAFRYAVTSGQNLGREQLARFDADTRVPVFAYPLLSTFSASVAGKGRPLSSAQGSFLKLEAANLQFVVLKAAEDGDGYVLRLQEVGGRAGEAEVAFPVLRIKEAFLSDGVEALKGKLSSTANSVRVPYKANQYVTVRLKAEVASLK